MSKPRQQGPHGTPEFIDLLSPDDRKLYDELHQNVGSPDFRYNRNRRISTFRDLLECIRNYCEHDESDRWKRYLVCGICWFKDGIAINTRQLKLLISKSKSAINGAFAKMGYQTVPTKGEEASLLVAKIPFLIGRYADLRQWTIRKINLLDNETQIKYMKCEGDEENETENKPEVETKDEEDTAKKSSIDPEFDAFSQEPFQIYDFFDDCFKDPSEKDQEFNFVNFYNDGYDPNCDYCFSPNNSNVFTLTVNPYSNVQLSIIKEAMKNYYSDKSKEMNYYSKEF